MNGTELTELDVDRYPKRDTWINWLIGISVLSLLVILLFVIFAVPNLRDTRSNVKANQRTDEIASCRAIANATVAEARNIKVEMERKETRARNHVANLTSEVTEVAIFDEDDVRLTRLRSDLAHARVELTRTERATDKAAEVETARQNEYSTLVELALNNPDEFLQQCKDDFNE